MEPHELVLDLAGPSLEPKEIVNSIFLNDVGQANAKQMINKLSESKQYNLPSLNMMELKWSIQTEIHIAVFILFSF